MAKGHASSSGDQGSASIESTISVGDIGYVVKTDGKAGQKAVVTSVFSPWGETVKEFEAEGPHPTGAGDDKALHAFVKKRHIEAIDEFVKWAKKRDSRKDLILEEAKKHLRGGRGRAALQSLKEGLDEFPSDPLLLSNYGCLVSSVEKRHTAGIKLCEEAFRNLRKSGPRELLPVLFLNLGRACLSANNRGKAVTAFGEGLKADPGNRDLLWEMKKLGTRKPPPVPFLKRNNPINKYLGKLLSKVPKKR